ncbi:HepT-like ribonuclease domain-containing protein [Calditrichota bacterium GD2]
MKDKDRIIIDYLNDILDSIIKIKTFLKDVDYPIFQKDVKTQYAVIRALEIIGEASKKIPQEVKDNYSWIPWRFMAGMRDKLIHDYFGIDIQVIWNTATKDILKLEEEIKNMVSSYLK